MAFIAPIMAGAGLALGVYGASKSASASRKQATAERVAAGFEADQLDQRARETVAVGSFRADQITKRAKQIVASQRAAAAAGGGDSTDQTATAFTDDTIRKASIDSLLEMANAESDARKDKLHAIQTRETGQRMGEVIKNRARGELIGGVGTLLSGAADWADRFGG